MYIYIYIYICIHTHIYLSTYICQDREKGNFSQYLKATLANILKILKCQIGFSKVFYIDFILIFPLPKQSRTKIR